jgi:membrane fusion protein, multidrug efflux system
MDEKPAAATVPADASPSTEAKPVKPLPPLPPPRSRRRKWWLIGAGGVLLIVVVVGYYLLFVAPYESTDDAFIENHVTLISPRVSGPVVRLLVDDNQVVKTGDLLVEIDPNDYEVALAQAQAALAVARAELEQAKAQTVVDEAVAAQQQAAVAAAEAESERAAADMKRYQSVESRAVSRSQFDLAQAQQLSTAADVDVARNRAKAATAQVAQSRTQEQSATARVQQAEANVRQAELNLSYTKIVAPMDGRVTRRTVEQGAYLQTGQALLALVPEQVWVVANFKETQLTYMRPGQPVTMSIDAYPQKKFKGKVDSLQAGSGARFSLIPPENAVGNYVKVVQRVPVKIVFDEPTPPELDISPGISVVPEVKVK